MVTPLNPDISKRRPRRHVKDYPSLTPTQVKDAILGIQNVPVRALVAFLYLTGCRIEEACRYQRDIRWGGDRRIHSGIRKYQITYDTTHKCILVRDVRTLKKKTKWGKTITTTEILPKATTDLTTITGIKDIKELADHYVITKEEKQVTINYTTLNTDYRRTIPIPIKGNEELLDTLHAYIATKDDGDELWAYTQEKGSRVVSKHTGMFSHLFRHYRLTHLVQYEGYDGERLRQFTGWASAEEAAPYIHLRWTDLLPENIQRRHQYNSSEEDLIPDDHNDSQPSLVPHTQNQSQTPELPIAQSQKDSN
jgi:integrase